MPPFPGTSGDDVLYGTDDSDTMTGLAGNDRLFGFGDDDTLDGGGDSDILEGGTGADTMTGGAGNDFYVVDNPGDQVIEQAGGGAELVFTHIDYTLPSEVERIAVYQRSSTFAVDLTGNALANELIGNDGANFLNGGDGRDIMKGAGGDDQYLVSQQGTVTIAYYPSDGGPGGLGNYYLHSNQPDVINEHAGGGNDTIWVPFTGSATFHTYFDYSLIKGIIHNKTSHVENLAVYDPASTYAVNLQGDFTNNQVRGNAGQNVLDGWSGADVLIGYGGDDIYFVDNAGDVVTEAASAGYDTVYLIRGKHVVDAGLTGYTLPAGVERLIGTANVAFTLTGNSLDNEITGNASANVIDGGAGADLMMGGNGNDIYYVDHAGDQVSDTSGNDEVRSTISYRLGSHIDNLTGLGTSAISLIGNSGANVLTGNDGANSIDGGAGADTMSGQDGNDTYFVDNTGDAVTESAGEGFDTVYVAQVSFTLGENVDRGGASSRTSTAAFNLTGSSASNELWGNNGANVIDGKHGMDILQGLGGADQFRFSTPLTGPSNVDQLIDFLTGIDEIALDDAIFEALAPGALAAGSFIIGTEAQDPDDFIMYDPTTGFLYYDGDATGTYRPSVHFATVHEGSLITSADFLIV